MASSPLDSLHDHARALCAADADRIAATATFPFFQGAPDGTKEWFETKADHPLRDGLEMSLLDVRELTTSTDGSLVVFEVTMEWRMSGQPTVRGRSLWATVRRHSEWKVIWRQFLGVVQSPA